jgi:hypothetical protein
VLAHGRLDEGDLPDQQRGGRHHAHAAEPPVQRADGRRRRAGERVPVADLARAVLQPTRADPAPQPDGAHPARRDGQARGGAVLRRRLVPGRGGRDPRHQREPAAPRAREPRLRRAQGPAGLAQHALRQRHRRPPQRRLEQRVDLRADPARHLDRHRHARPRHVGPLPDPQRRREPAQPDGQRRGHAALRHGELLRAAQLGAVPRQRDGALLPRGLGHVRGHVRLRQPPARRQELRDQGVPDERLLGVRQLRQHLVQQRRPGVDERRAHGDAAPPAHARPERQADVPRARRSADRQGERQQRRAVRRQRHLRRAERDAEQERDVERHDGQERRWTTRTATRSTPTTATTGARCSARGTGTRRTAASPACGSSRRSRSGTSAG